MPGRCTVNLDRKEVTFTGARRSTGHLQEDTLQQLLNIRLRRLLPMLVALFLAFVAISSWGAPAANASAAAETHCAVLLGKAEPAAQSSSPVLASSCVSGAGTSAVALSSVPILTIYENLNYAGSSKTFYGSAPCDSAGYFIDVGDKGLSFGWWRTHVSSMRYGNNCAYINAYQGGKNTGFCQQYHGNVGYVGAAMNDKVWSLHIQSAWRAC
jgi:hypothetical protein